MVSGRRLSPCHGGSCFLTSGVSREGVGGAILDSRDVHHPEPCLLLKVPYPCVLDVFQPKILTNGLWSTAIIRSARSGVL